MLYSITALRYVQHVNPVRHELVTERIRAGMALKKSVQRVGRFPATNVGTST